MAGGRADRKLLLRSATGRALCRWCSIEVGKRRQTFCSDDCVHEWRLRTNPGYLRQHVLARDRGVCARCTMDTLVAFGMLKRSRGARRKFLLEYWGLNRLTRKSLWDADHILPVVEGGGECDLSNLRTLCLACHRDATDDLRRRRRALASGAMPGAIAGERPSLTADMAGTRQAV